MAPDVPPNKDWQYVSNCSEVTAGNHSAYPPSSFEDCEWYCPASVTYWRCVSGGVCDGPITTIEPGGRRPADTYYSFEDCDTDCNSPF